MSTSCLSETPLVHPGAEIVDSRLGPWTEVGPNAVLENVDLGSYSYLGQNCIVQNAVIGKFANIAASVRVGPTMHPMDRPSQHHFTYRRRMYAFDRVDDEAFFAWRRGQVARIGHDTWIGHGAIIMPGVCVGEGAVVGAGAVLTRDLRPYGVAVGVPARLIRMRFPDDVVRGLLELAWWDWSHDTIRERLADFSGSVVAFLGKYRDA